MHKTLDEMDALKACWMTGGTSDKLCPEQWQGFNELSRLAIAGQFTRIATRPASPDGFELRPEIPPLSLPVMPEALRPQFRRILDSKLANPASVVQLIAARGYCVNPIDWMPKQSDTNLPEAYDAWQDWMEGNVADYTKGTLNADTWDSFPVHSRHRELTAVHAQDPDTARELVTAVVPTLSADQRLRMLECLRPGLTDSDKALLEGFAKDRSTKVQTFVKVQLARLGQDFVSDEAALEEVADFLEVQRAGMLTRRKLVTARKLKNDAQRKRRKTVLRAMSLHGLTNMLKLPADDFIEMWDFGGATEEIAEVIATSGTDNQVKRFVERCVEQDVDVSQALMDRISDADRLILGQRVLMKDEWHFSKTVAWFPTPDGSVGLPKPDGCKPLMDLIKLTVQDDKNTQDQMIAEALNFLGLIADRDTAAALVDRLLAAGVMTVDPRLALLRLNAAL